MLRDTLARFTKICAVPLEEFEGDTAHPGGSGHAAEGCLQQQEQPQEKRLSPWLWALPLALLVVAGSWLVLRTVEGRRVDAYVQRLRDEPGVVVTGAERRDGKWHVSGLRDPLATDPADLLAQSNLDPARVVGHWEPYQALNPAIVLKRIAASSEPAAGGLAFRWTATPSAPRAALRSTGSTRRGR